MSAEESLRSGNLEEALRLLQEQVRNDPSSPKHRVFLFQLLCVLGEWERASTQLEVVGEMDAPALAMVQTYREALRCEAIRRRVFAGKSTPLFLGDPDRWVALLLQALALTAEEQHEKSRELRDQAFEEAPATAGRIGDVEFSWIADADVRMGPVLEAVVNGRYYWIPFHRLKEVHLDEPEDLRDAVWMPGRLVFANGGEAVALLPTRYPGSEQSSDPLLRLARKTEWESRPGDVWLGVGQRMLATDQGEFPLMDVRTILLDVAPVESGEATTSEAAGG